MLESLVPKLSERFWSKVDKSGDCWEWMGAKMGVGYGAFWYDNKLTGAHRFAYYLERGTIPAGMCVCHHCDNPSCVKFSHLFLGTYSDNLKDAVAKGRVVSPDNRGTNNGNSRLTINDVHEIRRLRSLGVTHSLLGKMWGISEMHASYIVRRIRWKHI